MNSVNKNKNSTESASQHGLLPFIFVASHVTATTVTIKKSEGASGAPLCVTATITKEDVQASLVAVVTMGQLA
ncbi:hypothetical protein E2C01_017857 [Portunus trituberculatus]|uniref:Uncharacterized protein n=1 Tax=Portunus trituberculatus TaxID=210409 RepID=A0A5B7DUY2_PORTR|nr:hypothetical protein [Portunus trituberculatus]